MQLQLTFNPVHVKENNFESQNFLNENRNILNIQCWTVLKRMLNGEKLSYLTAINTGIGDIRRRAKDLIDGFGIPVRREWAVIDGVKQSYKWYYIASEDVHFVHEKIVALIEAKK